MITAALSYTTAPWFDALLQRLLREPIIEKILIISDSVGPNTQNKCEWIAAGPLVSGATLAMVIGKVQTKYLLLIPDSVELYWGPRTLERLLEAAEISGTGMVYADFIEAAAPPPGDRNGDSGRTQADSAAGGAAGRRETTALQAFTREHPVNDYQLGSLRDDFDFGPLLLFGMDAVRDALKKYGFIPPLYHAGLYDLRLKIATDHLPFHLPEYLCTVVLPERFEGVSRPDEAVEERTGDTPEREHFAYCDPRQHNRQKEMENVATAYLKRIGAWLRPRFRNVAPASHPFPVEASIVIPVKNRVKTIADSVRSALSQEADFSFNCIVIDNHSTDGTTAVLAGLVEKHPRLIHLVPVRRDLGIGGCWNEAIYSEYCGRFAVQLDSDDIYSAPDTLRRIVDIFASGAFAMVIGAYTLVDERGNILPPGLVDHREWTEANGRNNALRINGLGAPRAFQTDLVRDVGFLNVSYGEDYGMALRLSREYRIGRIYESLYLCRRWSGNTDSALTVLQRNRNDVFKDTLRTLEIMARRKINRHGKAVSPDTVRANDIPEVRAALPPVRQTDVDFLVRPWQKSDLRAIREITWESWQDAYATFIPASDLKTYFDTHYSLHALRSIYTDPFVEGFIGEADLKPAGYIRTRYVRGDDRFYVTSLYILPEYQGHGLGGRLLAAAERCALRYGTDVVWLGVMKKNRRALAWYRKKGFRFVKDEPFAMASTVVAHLIGYRKIAADPGKGRC